MKSLRIRHHDRGGPGRAPAPAAETPEVLHDRALLLGQVATEGLPGAARVLRLAAAGDPAASGICATSLVHALPGVGTMGAFDVLMAAQIRGRCPVGALDAEHRAALIRTLYRYPPESEGLSRLYGNA
jgi:hypothetical protein